MSLTILVTKMFLPKSPESRQTRLNVWCGVHVVVKRSALPHSQTFCSVNISRTAVNNMLQCVQKPITHCKYLHMPVFTILFLVDIIVFTDFDLSDKICSSFRNNRAFVSLVTVFFKNFILSQKKNVFSHTSQNSHNWICFNALLAWAVTFKVLYVENTIDVGW